MSRLHIQITSEDGWDFGTAEIVEESAATEVADKE